MSLLDIIGEEEGEMVITIDPTDIATIPETGPYVMAPTEIDRHSPKQLNTQDLLPIDNETKAALILYGNEGTSQAEASATATSEEDITIHRKGQEPLYNRTETPHPLNYGRPIAVTYRIKKELFAPVQSPTAIQASVIRERATDVDCIMLAVEAMVVENTRIALRERLPCDGLYIRAAHITAVDDSGSILPKRFTIPAAALRGFNTTSSGPLRDVFSITQESVGNFINWCIKQVTKLEGYSQGDFFRSDVIRLRPDGFYITIEPAAGDRPRTTTRARYTRAYTSVTGYDDKTMAKINKVTSVPIDGEGVIAIKNLDNKGRFYCLIDSLAILSDIDATILMKVCGDPTPLEFSIEKHAQMLSIYLNVDMTFYKLVPSKEPGKSPTREVIYKTTPSKSTVTYNFLVLGWVIVDAEGNKKTIQHVFYITTEAEHITIDPSDSNTIMLAYDLETYVDMNCYNTPYALNIMAYKLPRLDIDNIPSTPAGYYKQAFAYNIDNGTTVPMIKMNEDGSIIYGSDGRMIANEKLKECAKVYFDTNKNVMANLKEVIRRIKELNGGTQRLNIMLIGFNSAKFDNFMLVEYLEKIGIKTKYLDINLIGGRLLGATWVYDEKIKVGVWDIRQHTQGSLRGKADVWNVPSGGEKGDLDHLIVQEVYDICPIEFDKFIEANQQVITTYCKQDVITTALLHLCYKIPAGICFHNSFLSTYGISSQYLEAAQRIAVFKAYPEDKGGLTVINSKDRIRVRDPSRYYIIKSSKYKYKAIDRVELAYIINKVKWSTDKRETIEDIKLLNMILSTRRGTEPYDSFIKELNKVIDVKSLGPLTRRVCMNSLVSFSSASIDRQSEIVNDILKRMDDILCIELLTKVRVVSQAIESYPTAATLISKYAEYIGKLHDEVLLTSLDSSVAQLLRERVCIAGRSDCRVGIYDKAPLGVLDVVSLYPTVLMAPQIYYGLEPLDKDTPAWAIVDTFDWNEDHIQVGLWLVTIIKQPKMIVIPSRTKEGIDWQNDPAEEGKPYVTLVYTIDVFSLKYAEAIFSISWGIVATRTSNQAIRRIIQPFREEKTYQDALNESERIEKQLIEQAKVSGVEITKEVLDEKMRGLKRARWPGDRYNIGTREFSKNLPNTFSGICNTRQRIRKQTISDCETDDYVYSECAKYDQARACMEAREMFMQSNQTNELELYTRRMDIQKEKEQLLYLKDTPATLSNESRLSTWTAMMPRMGRHSLMNGEFIYAAARYLMVKNMYLPVGIDNVYMTETDSAMIPMALLNKYKGMKTPEGKPLLYANRLHALGLALEVENTEGAKDFGQLELDTHQGLMEFIEKVLLIKYKATLTLSADGDMIIDNKPTGLKGPYACITAKKSYTMYMQDKDSGNRVHFKTKCKGVSQGKKDQYGRIESGDMIIRCDSSSTCNTNTFLNKMNNMGDWERIHWKTVIAPNDASLRDQVKFFEPEDLLNFMRIGHMHIIQHNIAMNMLNCGRIGDKTGDGEHVPMKTRQRVIIKDIRLPDMAMTSKHRMEIEKHVEVIKGINRYKLLDIMNHSRSSYHRKNRTVWHCIACGSIATGVDDRGPVCSMHKTSSSPQLCKAKDRMGRAICGYEPKYEGYCIKHKDGLECEPTLCEHKNEEGNYDCNKYVALNSLYKPQPLCDKHGKDLIISKIPKCRHITKRGGTCNEVIHMRALRRGLCLCIMHLENSPNIQEQQQRLELTEEECNTYISILQDSTLEVACDISPLCQKLITTRRSLRRRGLCQLLCCAPTVEGTCYCRKHQPYVNKRTTEPSQVTTIQKGMKAAMNELSHVTAKDIIEPISVPCVINEVKHKLGHNIEIASQDKNLSDPHVVLTNIIKHCTAIKERGVNKGQQCGSKALYDTPNGPRCKAHLRK